VLLSSHTPGANEPAKAFPSSLSLYLPRDCVGTPGSVAVTEIDGYTRTTLARLNPGEADQLDDVEVADDHFHPCSFNLVRLSGACCIRKGWEVGGRTWALHAGCSGTQVYGRRVYSQQRGVGECSMCEWEAEVVGPWC